MDTNIIPPQQFYLIQLDQNVPFDPQPMPLHVVENNLDGQFILPFIQQKHEQPLQVFVEPPKQIPDVAIMSNTEFQEEVAPNDQINPAAPVNETEVEETEVEESDIIHSSVLVNKLNVTVSSVRTQTQETTVNLSPNDLNCDVDVEVSTKQRIRNFVHMRDTKAVSRAVAVLPAALHMRRKLIFPRRTLAACIRFGPVQGIPKFVTRSEAANLLSNSESPVFLLNQDEDDVILIDVADKDKSNWLGLLPLGEAATPTSPTTANVWLYEEKKELYVLTVEPIRARTPLRLGYSKTYFEDHNIQEGPVLDIETANSVQWWCNECNRALPTAAFLQRHTDLYHKVTVKSNWAAYRCKHCRRPFGRLYTLKRHMRIHCTKNPNKHAKKSRPPIEVSHVNPEPDDISTLEENRIPSDESFQNFTNSLDFSTNLFDTDRMADLDLTSQSRPDSEIDPYAIEFRDDNDLGFTNASEPEEIIQEIEEDIPILETCSYCDQFVAKDSKNKHLSECPSRLICECGRVFRHKKSLALHIRRAHPSSVQPNKSKKDKPKVDKVVAYNCQECPLGFKRRGMLVNHLWSKHKMISTMPVEKKVKRYPCVACPRIYCSSSKRNKHIEMHHPGAEKLSAPAIEGGVKSCQPASCTQCPRQYATRAKLLQHIRATHPHLANEIMKQEMEIKAEKSLKSMKKVKVKIEKDIDDIKVLHFKFQRY